MHHERGAVLAVTIMIALITAIAVYAMLVMASGQARQAAFNAASIRARYAAEVGLVWGQQQLRQNAAYCGVPDPPMIDGLTVDVTVTGCGTSTPKITAVVNY